MFNRFDAWYGREKHDFVTFKITVFYRESLLKIELSMKIVNNYGFYFQNENLTFVSVI